MQRLLQGKHLLEGGTYFNEKTQRCGANNRAALIADQVLIRGNTVNKFLPQINVPCI